MHTYSIYYRKDLPLDGKGLVIVREAFSWFALLIPLLWGLWYRLWLFLLLYLAISFFLQTVLEALPLSGELMFLMALGSCLIVAFAAPFIRSWTYERAGYQELEPVLAGSRQEAERAVLEYLKEVRKTDQELSQREEDLYGRQVTGKDDDYSY